MDKNSKELIGEKSPEPISEPISKSRRKISKAGLLAAPIITSLSSQPVFATQCLSNILSGNLSNPDRGNCSEGYTPVELSNDIVNWSADENKVFNEIVDITGTLIFPGSPNSHTLREIMDAAATGVGAPGITVVDIAFAAAYVNILHFPGKYILTLMNLQDVWAGEFHLDSPEKQRVFLEATWGVIPPAIP